MMDIMDRKTALKEFRDEFAKMKQELGFKSTYEELEEIFFLEDAVLKGGFVSSRLSRMVCGRIVELLMSWNGYLHSLVMPNPQYLLGMTESQMFSDGEKNHIMDIMAKTMALVLTNTYVGVAKDKNMEAKFIDDSVQFWKKTLSPELKTIVRKANEGWKKRAENSSSV